jgi:hypothetical protein
MQKKLLELFEIDLILGELVKLNPELSQSKLLYAWRKFYKINIQKVFDEYQEKIMDIRLNHAKENKDGAVMTDPSNHVRGYVYTKDELKKCIDEERVIEKEYNEKVIEVEPYICSSIPEQLTEEQKEMLTGIII